MEKDEIAALLNEKFDGINEKFEGINAKFEGINTKFEGINTKLNGLDTEVRKLRVDSHELKGMLQRNNELIYAVDQNFEHFRSETRRNFKDVKKSLGVANAALTSRVDKIEKAS